VIRKQLAGLLIAPGVRQLRILGGVLHILMAHPILDEAEFSTGVEEMRGNGMFEVMELALLWRQARLLAIGLHGTP
jgi:hypothetical protein